MKNLVCAELRAAFVAAQLFVGIVSAGQHLEPLPVTAIPERPLIVFEAEPLAADTPTDPAMPAYGGKILTHDGKSCHAGDRSVVLSQPGHKSSSVTLSYSLEPRPRAGKYAVWTAFTVGGVAGNTFTIRAGSDPEKLGLRLSFSQRNVASWQTAWQKGAGTLVIFPSDRCVTIEVTGMASDKKVLDAFLLEPLELFPAEMGEADGALRAALLGAGGGAKAARQLYVLDHGTDAAGMNGLLADILRPENAKVLAALDIKYCMGREAQEVAGAIGLGELPAVVATDPFGKVLGVAGKGATSEQLEHLLNDGIGPLPLPAFAATAAPAPKPFTDGKPAEWLAAGCWAGPCGLSMLGVDAERTIRPSAGDPCLVVCFDRAKPVSWRAIPRTESDTYVLESPTGNYVWPRGSGVTCLYFKVENETAAVLQVTQSGVRTVGWLDGEPLAFAASGAATADTGERPGAAEQALGRTDQGNTFSVAVTGREGPVAAPLKLAPGWHRLLLKLVMQHKDGETFQFSARFVDQHGNPLPAIGTVVDPGTELSRHTAAGRLVPYLYVNDPVSLSHPGEPLKLHVEFKNFALVTAEGQTIPALPLPAKLLLVMSDYDGVEVARREVDVELPGKLEVDFGTAPATGYYSLRPTLLSPDGNTVITVFPPDGFSVIGGTAAQKARTNVKKMATAYYFLANNPDRRHRDGVSVKSTFLWMDRMGIYRNVGSSPGFSKELWDAADETGIALSADFWDIHNADNPDRKQALAAQTAPYGRWYKSFNEVDIVPKTRGTAEHWVNRTRREYEAVKAARADGFYVGGSLVRVGAPDQNGWFEQCLNLGLDKYQDAWDVHAYPQYPPVFGGSISNSANETELGVLNAYRKIGRVNTLPFWLGETGARSCHGPDARRWQAEMVAKMTAWANARSDFQVIAFLIPFTYSRNAPAVGGKAGDAEGDIQAGHQPAEAAYYTVSALVDGLPYRRVESADAAIQTGYFGDTLMLWNMGVSRDYTLTLGDGDWLAVDVVGRVGRLPVNPLGAATLRLTSSPVYVLRRTHYEKLTAR